MPVYSVSCSMEQSKIITDKGLSPSTVFQMGLDVSAMGGINEIGSMLQKYNKVLEDLEIQKEKTKMMEDKHKNSQEINQKKNNEINTLMKRIEYLELQLGLKPNSKDQDLEDEKKAEAFVDKLIDEVKE